MPIRTGRACSICRRAAPLLASEMVQRRSTSLLVARRQSGHLSCAQRPAIRLSRASEIVQRRSTSLLVARRQSGHLSCAQRPAIRLSRAGHHSCRATTVAGAPAVDESASQFHPGPSPLRSPPRSARIPARSLGAGAGCAVGSCGSALAIAPTNAVISTAVRAIRRMWSSVAASPDTPSRLTMPHVGFNPVTPLAEGKRIEPLVSERSDP